MEFFQVHCKTYPDEPSSYFQFSSVQFSSVEKALIMNRMDGRRYRAQTVSPLVFRALKSIHFPRWILWILPFLILKITEHFAIINVNYGHEFALAHHHLVMNLVGAFSRAGSSASSIDYYLNSARYILFRFQADIYQYYSRIQKCRETSVFCTGKRV